MVGQILYVIICIFIIITILCCIIFYLLKIKTNKECICDYAEWINREREWDRLKGIPENERYIPNMSGLPSNFQSQVKKKIK